MLRAVRMQVTARLVGALFACAAGRVVAAGATDVLDANDAWIGPVGRVVAAEGSLTLRGEPGVEQAVVVWPGLELDAGTIAYATIEHGGLAPRHELSLYFRNADGEHVVEVPRTQRRATLALAAQSGWRGTVTEVGLVYGPDGNVPTLLADNPLPVPELALAPAPAAARARATATGLARIEPRRGPDNNLLLGGGLVAACGAALALALVFAALARGRGRRASLALAAVAFVASEVVLWRQWLVQHADTVEVAAARREAGVPEELDWELVAIAERIRAGLAGDAPRAEFQLAFEDPYVADRLRFHLLPMRAWRDASVIAREGTCVLVLTDREIPGAWLEEQTAFGQVVLAASNATPECRWNSSPSPR
ncbi:MAG TPA: hypothetical protein VND91_05455 [Candidatus Saccharimonadia bacterium]|nr:hypothetical protein [Candidatus Saccharimonadia bacterium]